MTSLFFETGARLLLPSGTRAEFVRWRARIVDLEVPASERQVERVAVLRIQGGDQIEFSEGFMRQARILTETSCPDR